jgi:lipopolysaccharide/colanic/teichoic acid biosynthesis glycosyltransferase
MDVMVKRVIPKVPVTKKIYFFITKGRNRVLSKAETFGRLYSCGFEIVNEKFIGDRLYYVARKVKEPAFPKNPTYGPLIRLKRHGKDGRMFNVYKLRTMHAYSEYLQEYVYQHNDLQEGGKFKNDFRITTEGKIFRKFWLDELPMFFNLLKGNMKLVGVRPLSSHYFNLYSDELKEKRIKTRPGLIPPFYADMPETLEEIMESEMKYLEAHAKNPIRTDINYLLKALNNILIKRARSN